MIETVNDSTLPAPDPSVNQDTAEYWAATSEGRLLIKRCRECGDAHWYPRPICPFCHSGATLWEQASGQGTIYSYSVCRRGRGAWGAVAPYVLAYVELDEGPRIMTNIVDCDPEGLSIGDRVEVLFHATEGGYGIPRFRPTIPTNTR